MDALASTLATLTQGADPRHDHHRGKERDDDRENDAEGLAHRIVIRVSGRGLREVAPRKPDHDRDPDDGVAHEIVDPAVSMSSHSPRLAPARAAPLLEFRR